MIYKKKYKPYSQINGLYINLDLDLDLYYIYHISLNKSRLGGR